MKMRKLLIFAKFSHFCCYNISVVKYIERAEYLRTLRELKDKHIIKVITGVRRAGKSTLMQLFREEIAQKIDKSRIQLY